MTGLNLYFKNRYKIRTADLIEFKSNSPLGKIIRWRTKQNVNHTSGVILYKMIGGTQVRRYIAEAIKNGFVLNYLSDVLKNYKGEAYLLQLKPEFYDYRISIAESALKFEGFKYDYKDLVRQISGPVELNKKRVFCSEAWHLALLENKLIPKDFNNGMCLVPGQFYQTGLYLPPIRIF